MRPKHYLALAVRIFAIVLFLYGIRHSALLIERLGGEVGVSLGFAIGSSVVPILIAALLWNFPLMIANTILKPEIDHDFEPMNAQSMLTVLILVVALYFLYYAAIDSIYWATLWQMTERSQSVGVAFNLNEEHKANMVATALELIVSILIVLKARSLACRMLRLAE